MLCRNCNYILSGKENFCPNCGTIPAAATQPFPTIKKIIPDTPAATEEKSQSQAIKADRKDFIFNDNDSSFFRQEHDYSAGDEEPEDFYSEEEGKKGKKSSAARVLILLFICCTLVTTAFVLADYHGIIPGFSALVSGNASTVKPEQQPTFSHSETVLDPEINYPMTTAYVLTGNGLTMRKGPGNGYAPLFSLTDLTQVQIFGGSLASTNWLYVYCGEKECYGWLDGSYLCSETVAENELTTEYESYEDVPTAYYRESEEEYSEYT